MKEAQHCLERSTHKSSTSGWILDPGQQPISPRYVWIPSTLDNGHVELQEGELDQVCPNWRTQNAFLATHTLLYYKRRVTKSSTRTFYMPDPGTGKIIYTDENFERI